MERAEFQKKLADLSILAKEKGNSLSTKEIQDFLASLSLNEEQLKLVYEYLAASHITIKGYIPRQTEERQSIPYTPEELRFLQRYQKELTAFARLEEEALEKLLFQTEQGDACAKAVATEQLLHHVLAEAKELHGQGLALEDLVQEGNIGLMLSLETLNLREDGTTPLEYVQAEIRRALREALEEAVQVRQTGNQIADKVNKLSDSIRELTDDLERQVTIEELSAFLDMEVEEIEDILKLAGEQVEMADSDARKGTSGI